MPTTGSPVANVFVAMKTEFSTCRKYRYTLWREWPEPMLRLGYYPGPHDQFVQFIGLNPSTADETKNDPTVRKCIGFAKRWGFGAMVMTNLFAFRATDPRKMMAERDPVGPDNLDWLTACAKKAAMVVAAWGTKGEFRLQDRVVCLRLGRLYCLRRTKGGCPQHPLFVPYESIPQRYTMSHRESHD